MKKKVLLILLILIVIQLFRYAFKYLFFSFMSKTILLDVLVNMFFMCLITIILILLAGKYKKDIKLFPEKFNKTYKIITTLLLLFLIITIIITKAYTAFKILSLVYNGIVTVLFEELLFRGIIYSELNKYPYAISTILFGLWHIGYIDTVIYRTSLMNPNANILNIMIWKVITGLALGIVFGYLRYKNKNVYSSILLHSFINIFGS